MILIADSGSTKTDWRLIAEDGTVSQGKTAGFNPYYQDSSIIYTEISKHLLPLVTEKITKIFYYGAGCTDEEKYTIVKNGIWQAFPGADIAVASDLLAAAHALCGHEAGIACILGTGANSCLYEGKQIVANRGSLGFWLGDEGSGGHLGKTLVQKYLLGEMPGELAEKFDKRYHLTRLEVLENAYKKPSPNIYFSSFSKFLFDNRSHPFAYQLIYQSFTEFFDKYIAKYENYLQYKVHFVGSVAFYYSDILRQVANDKGIVVRNILESPIAGLTLYHQKEALNPTNL
ncbi:MAG: N-acetylglucosamine kinase [Bacteroidota bacterium]